MCTFCEDHVESTSHLFVTFSRVSSVWYRIFRWLHVYLPRYIYLVFEFFLSLS